MSAEEMYLAYRIASRRGQGEVDRAFKAQAERIAINDVERFVDVSGAPRVMSAIGPYTPASGVWRDIHLSTASLFCRGLCHHDDGGSLGSFLQQIQKDCPKVGNFEDRAVRVMRAEDVYEFFTNLGRLLTYATKSHPSAYAGMNLDRFVSQVYNRFEKDDVKVVSSWFNEFYLTRN